MDTAGERLFRGHHVTADDDSPSEIAVWSVDGWHAAERLQGQVHQWTAQPRAVVGFRVARPHALVLAMDAMPAATAAGPQRLAVRVNGHVVVEDWQGARRVELAAHLLQAGENTLALEVPEAVRIPSDPRALGVLVRQLRIIDPAAR